MGRTAIAGSGYNPAEPDIAIVVFDTMRPKDREEIAMFIVDACLHVCDSVDDPAVCALVWALTVIPLRCDQFRNACISYRLF